MYIQLKGVIRKIEEPRQVYNITKQVIVLEVGIQEQDYYAVEVYGNLINHPELVVGNTVCIDATLQGRMVHYKPAHFIRARAISKLTQQIA